MVLDQPQMGGGMVAHAAEGVAVCGVAFHDGAADPVDHRLPELGAQEILIPHLAGVELDGYLAGEFNSQRLV